MIWLEFTGERFVPGARDVEPTFQRKMYQEHLNRYLFARFFVTGKRVLDMACGAGYGSSILLTGYPTLVIAVDVSHEAIQFASKHYTRRNLSYMVADVTRLPFKDAAFDVVVALEAIEHVKSQTTFVEEARRVLTPSGVLIISTPRKKDSARSVFHTHEFDFDEFRALLQSHFRTVRFYAQNNYHVSSISHTSCFKNFADIEFLNETPVSLADYFVAVCGEIGNYPEAVAVFNNDDYILNLEKDVKILRRAEEHLTRQLQDREQEILQLRRRVDQLSSLLRPLPLRAWRVYRQFGGRTLVKRIALYVLARLGLAEYNPPGALSVVDRAVRLFRNKGLKSLWRSAKIYLRTRRLIDGASHSIGATPVVQDHGTNRKMESMRVLFFVGCIEGESKRYRVFNIMDYLAREGVESEAIYEISPGQLQRLGDFDALVLMRTGLTPGVASAIDRARSLSIPVIFEIDDYVFEPEIMPYIDGIRGWDEERVSDYKDGVLAYRHALGLSDYVIVPTDYLAARVRELGKEAFVIRNGLSVRQIELATQARSIKPRRIGPRVTIGYFSGTYTHNADFKQAAPALLRILEEFRNVDLLIVGPLDLPPYFRRFRARIRRRPLVPWEQLPFIMTEADINIAPLELNNPFCEAKSELKYMDAAILKIPTVASPTDAFRRAIRSGENGFLAGTDDEWYAALSRLIREPALRQSIGDAAYQDVMVHYAPEAKGSETLRVFKQLLSDYRLKSPPHPGRSSRPSGLDVSWVVPEPFRGSGGHRNIFRAARYLCQFGHRVTIYVPAGNNFTSSEELAAFVTREFGEIGAQIILGTERIRPCDALFATHWSTVSIVLANKSKARRLLYFVQDYEPYFYPMSYEYVSAENTYKQGLGIITSGPWCAKILKERHGIDAAFFRFPVNRSIYFPRSNIRRREDLIIFFARPEMPRRLFPLGVEALQILNRRRPHLEIALFGSDALPKSISFPYKNLGSISNLSSLAELYSAATVALTFSTTNPSLVPFEIMACGCPIVDVDYGNNEISYGSRDNAMLVPPTPESVAGGIERLLDDDELRSRIALNGYKFAQSFPSEEEMARAVEEFILREVDQAGNMPWR